MVLLPKIIIKIRKIRKIIIIKIRKKMIKKIRKKMENEENNLMRRESRVLRMIKKEKLVLRLITVQLRLTDFIKWRRTKLIIMSRLAKKLWIIVIKN